MIGSMLGHCTTDRSGLQITQIKRHEIFGVPGGPAQTSQKSTTRKRRFSPFPQILLSLVAWFRRKLFRRDVVHDKGSTVDVGLQLVWFGLVWCGAINRNTSINKTFP